MLLIPSNITCRIIAAVVFFAQLSFGQWVTTSGPGGGLVTSMIMKGDTVFAGTSHGVFRSCDSGKTWKLASQGLYTPFNSHNQNVLSLGLNGASIYAGLHYEGPYRSIDNGSSWVEMDSASGYWTTISFTRFSINCFSADSGILFAGTEYGVFRTTNDGVSWVSVDNGHLSRRYKINCLGMLAGTDTLFAGTDSGLYIGTNAGIRWTAVPGFAGKNIRQLAVHGKDILIFVATNASTSGEIYSSINGSGIWTLVKSFYDVTCLKIIGNDIFAGTKNGSLYRSGDHGASWIGIGMGLIQKSSPGALTSIVVCGSTLLAGTSKNGVFRSTDSGAHWIPSNYGMTNIYVLSLAQCGGVLYAGTDQDGIFSFNNTHTWAKIDSGLTSSASEIRFYSLAENSGTLFAGTYYYLYKLLTSGETRWTIADSGHGYYSLASSNSTMIAGAESNGVHVSTNGGSTWVRVTPSTGLPKKYDLRILSLAIKDGVVFAGLDSGGVFRSSDNGATWTENSFGLPAANGVNALLVHGNSIFAGTGTSVFRSDSGVSRWTEVVRGLPSAAFTSLAASGKNLFAGTKDRGAYVSTNDGESWTDFNAGLPEYAWISSFAFVDQTVYASTYGLGVWSRPLSDVIPTESKKTLLSQQCLSDLLLPPSQSASGVSFSFTITKRRHVIIRINDLRGHKIATPVDGCFETGNHRVHWIDHSLATGCYMISMTAGSLSYHRTVYLLK